MGLRLKMLCLVAATLLSSDVSAAEPYAKSVDVPDNAIVVVRGQRIFDLEMQVVAGSDKSGHYVLTFSGIEVASGGGPLAEGDCDRHFGELPYIEELMNLGFSCVEAKALMEEKFSKEIELVRGLVVDLGTEGKEQLRLAVLEQLVANSDFPYIRDVEVVQDGVLAELRGLNSRIAIGSVGSSRAGLDVPMPLREQYIGVTNRVESILSSLPEVPKIVIVGPGGGIYSNVGEEGVARTLTQIRHYVLTGEYGDGPVSRQMLDDGAKNWSSGGVLSSEY